MSAIPPSRTPPLDRLTVDEDERIIASGARKDPSRIELVNGYMVGKLGKNVTHRGTTKEVLKALDGRLPTGWISQKEPVRIPAYNEPEPDIAIIRGTDDDYPYRIPAGDSGPGSQVIDIHWFTLGERAKRRRAGFSG